MCLVSCVQASGCGRTFLSCYSQPFIFFVFVFLCASHKEKSHQSSHPQRLAVLLCCPCFPTVLRGTLRLWCPVRWNAVVCLPTVIGRLVSSEAPPFVDTGWIGTVAADGGPSSSFDWNIRISTDVGRGCSVVCVDIERHRKGFGTSTAARLLHTQVVGARREVV